MQATVTTTQGLLGREQSNFVVAGGTAMTTEATPNGLWVGVPNLHGTNVQEAFIAKSDLPAFLAFIAKAVANVPSL